MRWQRAPDEMHVIGHFGAHTPFADEFLALLRRNAAVLAAAGFAVPDREVFAPVLREAFLDGDLTPERRAELAEVLDLPEGTHRAIFVNEHFWSSPLGLLNESELYADAEEKSGFFFDFVGATGQSLLVTIETMADFLPRFPNEPLRRRIARTDWADLFELSWFELVDGLRKALPECELLVLDYRYAPALMPRVFGHLVPEIEYGTLAGAYRYAKRNLHWPGRDRLAALIEALEPGSSIDPGILLGLMDSHPRALLDPKTREDLGIDEDLAELLAIRHREDLGRIRALAANADSADAERGFLVIPPVAWISGPSP